MRQVIQDIETLNELLPDLYGRPFAFDFETTGLSYRKDRPVGIALSFPLPPEKDIVTQGKSKQVLQSYYIVIHHTVELWDGTTIEQDFINEKRLANSIRGLFAQRDQVMVAHNAKFDMHFMHNIGVLIEGQLFDTMLAAQLIDENRENGLKALAPLVGVTEMPTFDTFVQYQGYGKKQILGAPLKDVANYAMLDTEVTWLLYQKFSEQLATEGANDAFYNVWMPLLPVLQQMEARGVALDLNLVKEMRTRYLEDATRYEHSIRQKGIEMVLSRYPTRDLEQIPKYYLRFATKEEIDDAYEDDEGNLWTDVASIPVPLLKKASKAFKPRVIDFTTGSGPQLKELIFDYLQVQVPDSVQLKSSPKTGGVSVDKDNLNTLLYYNAENPPQTLLDVLEWRKATKFISTYLDRFIEDADPNDFNSISTNFNQNGTLTGRLSSDSPNLQNIPSRGEVGRKHARCSLHEKVSIWLLLILVKQNFGCLLTIVRMKHC